MAPRDLHHDSSDDVSNLGDDGVTEGAEAGGTIDDALRDAGRFPFVLRFAGTRRPSVQPGGKPIRCSTHAGLRAPSVDADFAGAHSVSSVPCVGSPASATAVLRFSLPSHDSVFPGPLVPSRVVGVAHVFTSFRRDTGGPPLPVLCVDADVVPVASATIGVPHDKHPFPSVWCSHIGSAYREPDRIIPMRGKAPENAIQSSGNKGCDVLHDDESW
jgi:hypothetical protein